MSNEGITGINRGGAPCAKEVLCNPPAQARAINKARLAAAKAINAARLAVVKAQNEARLMRSMCDGLANVTRAINDGVGLSSYQMECYHNAAAVLDQPEAFVVAFDKLRESLIVKGA